VHNEVAQIVNKHFLIRKILSYASASQKRNTQPQYHYCSL